MPNQTLNPRINFKDEMKYEVLGKYVVYRANKH